MYRNIILTYLNIIYLNVIIIQKSIIVIIFEVSQVYLTNFITFVLSVHYTSLKKKKIIIILGMLQ